MSSFLGQPTPEAAHMANEIEKGLRWLRTNPESLVAAMQAGDPSILEVSLSTVAEVDPFCISAVLDQQLRYLIRGEA
ncbi:MAG: hypothetical protein ABIR75_16075 [Arachnia sp.]